MKLKLNATKRHMLQVDEEAILVRIEHFIDFFRPLAIFKDTFSLSGDVHENRTCFLILVKVDYLK